MAGNAPPIDELRARAGSSRLSRRLIISTEGKRTERNYIGLIASEERIPSPVITFAVFEGTDPLSVISNAIEARLKRIAEREYDPAMGDQTWALFDVDEHRDNDLQRFNKAIELARKEDVRLATSNPSFELWLLLHFQDQNANIPRSDAESAVRKHLACYDKKLTDVHKNLLKTRINEAIRRAWELDKRYANDAYYGTYPNPKTGVYELVQLLYQIGRKYDCG